jgi:3-hydroxyisobutyrate dehydrogenase
LIEPQMNMGLGFVGLGSMGAPMASNLVAAGFDVTVFDLEPARMAALRERGAKMELLEG